MEGASRSERTCQAVNKGTKKGKTLTMRLLHQLTEQETSPMARALFGLVGGLATIEAVLTHNTDHMIDKGELKKVMKGHAREPDVGGLDKDQSCMRKEGSHVETPAATGGHGKDGAEATETTSLSRPTEVRDVKGMGKLIQLPCGSGVREVGNHVDWKDKPCGGKEIRPA